MLLGTPLAKEVTLIHRRDQFRAHEDSVARMKAGPTRILTPFELKSVGASYSGVLNAERTALAGTYTEGTFTAPLTFQRSATTKDKKK